MKAYNDYMSKISVSNTLHQKLVFCTRNDRLKRRPVILKRYVVSFAFLAVFLTGVLIVPKLIQHNIKPTPGDKHSVLQSDSRTPLPSKSNKYSLNFNRANRHGEAKDRISGHFWQDLTDNEIKAVLPALVNTHTIKATGNFQSGKNGTTLLNIDANAKSETGIEISIKIAPGEIALDYVFDSETKSSDVLGVAVTAGCFETKPNNNGIRNVICFATFKLTDVAYYVELNGAETEKEALKNKISELVGLLIEGGAAHLDMLHPVVPELREDRLSLDEARADIDFGAYMPRVLPDGFVFEDARRYINQVRNALYANWNKGMGYINWRVSHLDNNDKSRITSVSDIRNYDLALYPIPRADSVPDQLREVVDNPIFRINELTLDVVKARTYETADKGDEPGQRMRFSVLYRDVLVELNVKGASSEAIFDILQQIK